MAPQRRLLELFSGTGSVGRVFAHNGWHVTSLDLDPRWKADLRKDVLRWDYRAAFAPGTFDCVWASPPCTEFSIALTTRPRRVDLGNRIVRRTLRIIEYLQPRLWFLENPQTGLLKAQRFMRDLRYVDVDYCRFSDWGYRKRTRVWYGGFPPPPGPLEDRLCLGLACPNLVGDGRLQRPAGRGSAGRSSIVCS